MIRTLTEDDDLALERVGYERGTVLRPSTGSPDAHQYRVEVANPLVVDGLVLLEEDGGAYRFLDTNRVPLTVRDLRRFRILVKVADARRRRGDGASTGVRPATATRPQAPDVAAGARRPARRRPRQRAAGGVDFAVPAAGAPLGPECVMLEVGPDGYVVGYRDAGTTSTLFASRSFAQARAVFLDEACWLGAERGRGPYVGRDQAVGTEGWTSAQIVAAYERRLLDGRRRIPDAHPTRAVRGVLGRRVHGEDIEARARSGTLRSRGPGAVADPRRADPSRASSGTPAGQS